MKRIITYRQFRGFLESEGYAENEIRHLFGAVKSMDRETRHWVVEWMYEGVLPKKEVENVTAEFLINECGYQTINAFIILDWLKADPQAAKYFVAKLPHSDMTPDERVSQEMEEFLQKEGIEPKPEESGDPNESIVDDGEEAET